MKFETLLVVSGEGDARENRTGKTMGLRKVLIDSYCKRTHIDLPSDQCLSPVLIQENPSNACQSESCSLRVSTLLLFFSTRFQKFNRARIVYRIYRLIWFFCFIFDCFLFPNTRTYLCKSRIVSRRNIRIPQNITDNMRICPMI